MGSDLKSPRRSCGACRFLIGAPAALERAVPGLNILSSAYGSVLADTALCGKHEHFVTCATEACSAFEDVVIANHSQY